MLYWGFPTILAGSIVFLQRKTMSKYVGHSIVIITIMELKGDKIQKVQYGYPLCLPCNDEMVGVGIGNHTSLPLPTNTVDNTCSICSWIYVQEIIVLVILSDPLWLIACNSTYFFDC